MVQKCGDPGVTGRKGFLPRRKNQLYNLYLKDKVMVNNFYGILSEYFYGILILLTSLLVNSHLAN